jgi:hypothetical protein
LSEKGYSGVAGYAARSTCVDWEQLSSKKKKRGYMVCSSG